MRTQNRKKIHIQPIKSPSPDIGNRNMIRDTIAPLQQIQKYQQTRSRSKSPRITSSLIFNSNGNQNEKLRTELGQVILSLRNKQSQNRSLVERNNILNKQILYYRSQFQKMKKSQLETTKLSNFSNSDLPNNFNENENILKEFNSRTMKLSQENKRIAKKLQQQINKVQILTKQKEIINNQINFYKRQSKIGAQYPKQRLESVYLEFQQTADKRIKGLEASINNKIHELQIRVDKVKVLQNILEERVDRQKGTTARTYINSTPPKNQSIATTRINKKYDTIIDAQSQENDSPMKILKPRQLQQKLKNQNMRLSDKITMLNRQLDYLRQCCGDRQRQINNLQLKIKQLKDKPTQSFGYQSILNKKMLESSTFNETQLSFTKQKVKNLELDLKNKQNTINNLRQQCSLKERQCTMIKKRLQEANYFLQNQMPNFQKVIDQERHKNQKLQDQISMLNRKFLLSEQQKNKELGQLKQQISKLPKLLNDMKSIQQEMEQKGNTLAEAFRQYLLFIQQIKQALTGSKMQKVIQGTFEIQENIQNIEKIKAQSLNLINELRKKLLSKDEKIIEVQKNNYILQSQIQQLKIQQTKLKQLIQEYSAEPIKNTVLDSNISIRKNSKISFSLKQVIQEAMSGINKLQSEVNHKLIKINKIIQP